MDYIGNCPNCQHHTLITTVKKIVRDSERKPQRQAKCENCGKLRRITVIGEVYPDISGTPNAEFATHNRLIIKLW